jgi:hypothetical protein
MNTPRGKEFPTYKEVKEGQLDWSHLAYELSSRTRYSKKYRSKDRNDTKTRKKTYAATG